MHSGIEHSFTCPSSVNWRSLSRDREDLNGKEVCTCNTSKVFNIAECPKSLLGSGTTSMGGGVSNQTDSVWNCWSAVLSSSELEVFIRGWIYSWLINGWGFKDQKSKGISGWMSALFSPSSFFLFPLFFLFSLLLHSKLYWAQ